MFVRGIAKEAPAITVNAADVELTTAMDANVVLNKPATLTVADGAELGTLKVNANADIKVADGASISSSVKTDVTLNAEANVSLGKGAEGSSVKAGNENVTPTVENKTDSAVTVTDSKGQDSSVGAGQSGSGEPVKDTESNPDSGSGDTGGTESTGGSSNPGSSDTDYTNPDSSDSGSTNTGGSDTGEVPAEQNADRA